MWVRYFTSSKIVKAYVEKHGNPDVIKISREFADSASARNHESRFLKRVDAKNSDRWLNQTNGGKDFCTKPGRVKTDSEKSAARSASLGLRAYHKEGTVKKFKENPGGEWIKGYPENHHGLRGTKASLKAKENMEAAWINRKNKNPGWLGTYVTPWGMFDSPSAASSSAPFPISQPTISKYCRSGNQSIFTGNSAKKFLNGKTPRDCGYSFIASDSNS